MPALSRPTVFLASVAEEAEDVGISGPGAIDDQGAAVEGLRVEVADGVFQAQPRSALWMENVAGASLGKATRLPPSETDAPVVRSVHCRDGKELKC